MIMDNDRKAGAANDAAGKVESTFGPATRDAGEAATDIAKSAMDTGTEYYREGSRALVSTVKEQPLSSLLVAGVVGFILALMLARPPGRRNFHDYYER
jgi:ElaB/YqjD/DUF883 family membrane-anchored ribosome-binding protein